MNAGMQMRAVIEIDALLRVRSVAADVNHHLARDIECRKRAHGALDQRQSHVDARCDARARRDRVVRDEQAMIENAGFGETPPQLADARPVRGATAAVEKTRLA